MGNTQDNALVYGVDGYNQCQTGPVSMAIRNKASDTDHIPLVMASNGTDVSACVNIGDLHMATLQGVSGVEYVVEQGVDLYNKRITGDVACSTTATGSCSGTGPKVICFEPGISGRDCHENRFNDEICTTLRANAGDNQQAICFSRGETGSGGKWWNGGNIADTLTMTSNEQLMPDKNRLQVVIEE